MPGYSSTVIVEANEIFLLFEALRKHWADRAVNQSLTQARQSIGNPISEHIKSTMRDENNQLGLSNLREKWNKCYLPREIDGSASQYWQDLKVSSCNNLAMQSDAKWRNVMSGLCGRSWTWADWLRAIKCPQQRSTGSWSRMEQLATRQFSHVHDSLRKMY